MLKRLSALGRVSLSLGLVVALVLGIPASAVYGSYVDASTDSALIMRGTPVVNDEEDVDDDGIDTLPPADNDTPTDSDGTDTPTPTDNDTPTPTDNDGTDSDGVDTPDVGLSRDAGSSQTLVRPGSPTPVMATFSKAVSGFTLDDVKVTNGATDNFAGSDGGAVYTFDVTANAIGEVTMDVEAGVAEDADGNGNNAAAPLSLGIPYDDNNNEAIDKNEVINAVIDYFDGRITKADVIDVIVLYFSP